MATAEVIGTRPAEECPGAEDAQSESSEGLRSEVDEPVSTVVASTSDAEIVLEKRQPTRTSATRRVVTGGGVTLLLCGVGCLGAALLRAYRRQQRELTEACKQLRRAQEQLEQKEQALNIEAATREAEQERNVRQLSTQVSDAQRELAAVRDMCKQAAQRLEQSMSDLSVSETELRSARTQLHTAGRDLALARAKLEATEGELGLTRSQNELMKREVDILRRQLREAGQQLEGYILVSRKRGVGAGGGVAEDGFGDSSREDDLALGADWDT